MNDFDIIVDSTANLSPDLLKRYGILAISPTYTVDGVEHYCFEEGVPYAETAKIFYDAMRAGREPKTSLIVEERFLEALTPSLEAGRDALLFTMSSGISGTYQQALAAKATLAKRFPDRKVTVVDSANASFGEGLLAIKAADLRDMGESMDACAEWLAHNTYKMNSYLTVEDLKYLRRGGRISLTLAIAGTLLNIKPLIKADGSANAKLTFYAKARGRRKALSALVEAFDANVVRPEAQTIAIAHADCPDEANELAETLKEHGARDVIVEYYDICSGTHVGPGTIAIFFLGADRRKEAAQTEKAPHGKVVPNRV